MKQPPRTLSERLATAAQACRAAHLLSCEATCREAIAVLDKQGYALERCRDSSEEAQKGGPTTMRAALEQIHNYSSMNWITPR